MKTIEIDDDAVVSTEEQTRKDTKTETSAKSETSPEGGDVKTDTKTDTKADTKTDTKTDTEKTETQKTGTSEEVFKLGEEAKTTPEISFTSMAKDIGIDLQENSQEKFVSAAKDFFEKAKTVVDLDLSDYNEEQQAVIKYLQDEGTSLADFFEPTKEFDEFLAKTNEEKVKEVFIAQQEKEGKKPTEEEIQEHIDELISEGKLDGTAKEYAENARKLKYELIGEIIAEKENKISEQQKIQEELFAKEDAEIISLTKNLTEYKGLNIPEKVRNYIIGQVRTGKFYEELNTPEAQLKGYLEIKFGKQIDEYLKKALDEESRKGYNKADEKAQQSRHNIPPTDTSSTSHTPESKENKGPFSSWADVEG